MPGVALFLAACAVGRVAYVQKGLPTSDDVNAGEAAGVLLGTPPLVPTGVSAKSGKDAVTLSWTTSEGAVLYVERASPVNSFHKAPDIQASNSPLAAV